MTWVLVGLQSYYSAALGMAWPPVLGMFLILALLLVRLANQGTVRVSEGIGLRSISILGVVALATLVNPLDQDPKTTLGVTMSVVTAALAKVLFGEHRAEFSRGIDNAVFIFVALWVYQAVSYFATGTFVDLVAPLSDQSSSYLSKKGLLLDGSLVPRFSGVFNEPGTYSTYVFALLGLRVARDRALDRLTFVGLITMILSMSLFGVVLAVSLLAVVILLGRSGLGGRAVATAAALTVLTGAWIIAGERIILRLGSGYSGLGSRTESVKYWLSNGEAEILRGMGLRSTGHPEWFLSNDLGLWFVLVFAFGLLALPMLVLIFWPSFRDRNVIAIAVLGLLLATKIKLVYPMFWFVVFCIGQVERARRRRTSVVNGKVRGAPASMAARSG